MLTRSVERAGVGFCQLPLFLDGKKLHSFRVPVITIDEQTDTPSGMFFGVRTAIDDIDSDVGLAAVVAHSVRPSQLRLLLLAGDIP
jgi:hypothetical protein